MGVTGVESERAERARAMVMLTLAEFRASQRADDMARHRLGRMLGLTSGEVLGTPAESAILRMVSIAEHFAMGRLLEVSEPHLVRGNEIFEWLWEDAVGAFEGAWGRRNDAWKRIHKVNVADASEFKRLDAFVQVRNAIAHGLGELTRRQLKDRKKTESKLATVGVKLSGNRVITTELTVAECARTAASFIRWLDQATR